MPYTDRERDRHERVTNRKRERERETETETEREREQSERERPWYESVYGRYICKREKSKKEKSRAHAREMMYKGVSFWHLRHQKLTPLNILKNIQKIPK